MFLFCALFVWGRLIRGNRAGERQLKTASVCPAPAFSCSRALGGLLLRHPGSLGCFHRRGWGTVGALELVESRQNEHSRSGVAKRSLITRTAASSSSSSQASIRAVVGCDRVYTGVVIEGVGFKNFFDRSIQSMHPDEEVEFLDGLAMRGSDLTSPL